MGSPTEPGPVATIFSVQHFCMHDGPGTRSVVFFKGCPLRCAWCSNPESWSKAPQLAYKAHVCIDCRRCVGACTKFALAPHGRWDAARCDACGACAEACPAGALVLLGVPKGVDALVEQLRPEFRLYAETGGGVTLSGGETTLQAEFAARLCERLHKEGKGEGEGQGEGVHVAIETCGLFKPSPAVDALLACVDLILFDIKLFDDAEHRRWCGAGNRVIKANLDALWTAAGQGGPPVWPRMPLIPTVTATAANVDGWAGFLAERGMTQVTLVPYHEYGAGKRAWLGDDVPPAPKLPVPDAELIAEVRARFASFGVEAFVPGHEPNPTA